MNLIILKNILFMIFTVFLFSEPAYSSDEKNEKNNIGWRPSNVPVNYIITPTGYFHPECVHIVEEGESINSDGSIMQRNGSNRSIPNCSYSQYMKNGIEITSNSSTPPKVVHSWAASVSRSISDNNGLTNIVGEWQVPDAPYAYNGQTLFVFNSIRTNNTIIQPVLGFNQMGGIGPQWSIASWAVVNNNAYKSNNTAVKPGDIIKGQMTRDIPNGVMPKSIKKWNISISILRDEKELHKQNLPIELIDSSYTYFDEGAYETYRNYETIECLEIAWQKNLKKMDFTFSTKILEWKNKFDGPEKAKSFIYEYDCGIKTSISKQLESRIYY